MKLIKNYSILIFSVMLMFLSISFQCFADNEGKLNLDEWYKWYNGLSEDEKLAVSYVPPGVNNSETTPQYSNFTDREDTSKDNMPPKTVNLTAEYNTKNIPNSLIKKAVKANNGISSAQLSVLDIDEVLFPANLTVKFSNEKAGNTAKLYQYNPIDNNLKLVSKIKISDNGECIFRGLESGGDFVIVLIK